MSSHSAERIGGWLLAPLAWLLVALLSTSLSLLIFANALMSSRTYALLAEMSAGHLLLWVGSLLFALAMWYYTLWLTIAAKHRTKALYYLAAHLSAAGDKGLCFFTHFRRDGLAPAAVSASCRGAVGPLFQTFRTG